MDYLKKSKNAALSFEHFLTILQTRYKALTEYAKNISRNFGLMLQLYCMFLYNLRIITEVYVNSEML